MKQPLVCGSCGGNTFVLEAEDNDLVVCANHRCGIPIRTIRPRENSGTHLVNGDHILYIRLHRDDYELLLSSGKESGLFTTIQVVVESFLKDLKRLYKPPTISLPQGRIGQGQGGTP